MTGILNDLRLMLCYRLLGWVLTLAPKDMREGRDLVNMGAALPLRNPMPMRNK